MEGAGSATSSPTAVRLPPQITPFVGRGSELAELAGLLSDPEIRLVTVLGPGGIGKTRLAVASAAALAPVFANGAAFVPLAPLGAASDILSALADSLGLRFYEGNSARRQLLAYLREKQMLLVLDNFEHLLEGATLVHDLLLASPGIKVLATSREKLNLGEEVRFQLGGMDFPQGTDSEGAPEALDLSLYGAVALFLQCAGRARPGYEPDEVDLEAVLRICRLVEGNPLGIILSAAWLESFSTQEIAAEIGRSLDFLETEMRDLPRRHRSIRAVFDSSWQQLSGEERDVFTQLAVFRGGFLGRAAECVAGAGQRSLIRLVNKSLLLRDPASGRYEIHELLAQYAAERLEASGQMAAARDRHCAYYAKFMEGRLDDILGKRQIEARDEIAADFENVRAAWSWAAGRRDGRALERMAKSIYVYCDVQSRNHDGEALFRQAREMLEPLEGEEPDPAWSRVLLPWYDMHTDSLGPVADLAPITAEAELGLRSAEKAGDSVTMGYCALLLGKLAADQGEHSRALRLYRRGLQYCPELEDGYYPYARMGHCYLALGRLEEALGCFERLWERAVEIGERTAVAWALAQIGEVEFKRGDHMAAVRHWGEAAGAFEQFGASMGLVHSQSFLSMAALIDGDTGRARELANAVKVLAEEHGFLPQHHHEARTVLGWLDILDERYESAVEGLEELMAADPAKAEAILGLLFAASALQMHQEAEGYLGAVLNPTVTYRTPAFEALQFLAASLILKRQGDAARSAELLALTLAHPARPKSFLRQWALPEQLRAKLRDALEPETFAAATARGEELDPSETLHWLREQFQVSASEVDKQLESRAPPYRPEPLPVEPLSKREMELLQLLKSDLTGPEIARELFISLNTVRFHTKNIYGKLGVNNRLAAVHRAEELGL